MATALVAALLAGCGPLGTPEPAGAAEEVLSSSAEELALMPEASREVRFEALRTLSVKQARARLTDGPSVFAIEREGRLVAAPLPGAGRLVGGVGGVADLDRSPDPWPTEACPALGGLSERQAAEAVAAGLLGSNSPGVSVERAAGAPYAAVLLGGRLRLNPSLLYLAFGTKQ